MRTAIALLAAVALVGAATPPARARATGASERLAARARGGDRVARTALLEAHMGLVRSVAFRYRDLGLPLEDLVQEGAIGLLTAIDDYDPSRGASFSTHAFWQVRAAITHALTAHGQLIRVPRPVLEHRRVVARARERLRSDGREPTVAQLAVATTLSRREVLEALAPADVASLDRPTRDGATFGALLAGNANDLPEWQVVDREQAHALRRALMGLRGRKRTIVDRHFGLVEGAETLTDIADDLHLSRERTRALKDEALRELAAELDPLFAAP